MRSLLYTRLCSIARRESGDAAIAEDVVQDALLAAISEGRADLADPATGRWLSGVVRNKARMLRRGAGRRRRREAVWLREGAASSIEASPDDELAAIIARLPPSLKVLAALILSGHTRAEIVWLLGISDTALRQRLVALRRRLRAAGAAMPDGLPGLTLELAYGRLREMLLPALRRDGGLFASHDPDGHLFFVRSSQNAGSRQLDTQTAPRRQS